MNFPLQWVFFVVVFLVASYIFHQLVYFSLRFMAWFFFHIERVSLKIIMTGQVTSINVLCISIFGVNYSQEFKLKRIQKNAFLIVKV